MNARKSRAFAGRAEPVVGPERTEHGDDLAAQRTEEVTSVGGRKRHEQIG